MNLILVKPSELPSPDGPITFPPADPRARHITQHLRKRSGDTVAVGVVDQYRCTADVALRPDGGVVLTPRRDTVVPQGPAPAITLLLAMPFPRRMSWLWPVIGSFAHVTRVVIVRGALTDAEVLESKCLRPEVYGPLLEKGMGQGARTRSVRVDVRRETVSRGMLTQLGLDDVRLPRMLLDCGDETDAPAPLHGAIRGCASGVHPDGVGTLALAIGPERGWTEDEAKVFRECGFVSTTLGSSILRVDAAVVGALSVATSALDAEWKRVEELKEEDCERNGKRAKTS